MSKQSTIIFTQKLAETALQRCAKEYYEATANAPNALMLTEYARIVGLQNFTPADFDFFVRQMESMNDATKYTK